MLGERRQYIGLSDWRLPRRRRSFGRISLCWYLHPTQVLPTESRLLMFQADWWLL